MITKEYFLVQVKKITMGEIDNVIDLYNALDELMDDTNFGKIDVYKNGLPIGTVDNYSPDVYDFLGDDYTIDELYVKLKEMDVTLKTSNEQDVENLFPS